MSDRPTPETDAFITSQDYSPTGHQWRNFTRKLERERNEVREKAERYRIEANAMMMQRDEARESLKHIGEYGTEEINAAIELRQKLAQALIERDDARELVKYYQQYSKLLISEINDTEELAHVCGWRSSLYEQGKVLREKIKQLEESNE